MVEIKAHRTRRIGGYSKSCATLRSAARARLGVAQFFDGLLAAACRLDAAYLCRLFRRFDHQSPYQFLMRLRMARAAELLQDANRLVKQVAHELRFSDPYHFSRAFKRVYGVPPEQIARLGRHELPANSSLETDLPGEDGAGPGSR